MDGKKGKNRVMEDFAGQKTSRYSRTAQSAWNRIVFAHILNGMSKCNRLMPTGTPVAGGC